MACPMAKKDKIKWLSLTELQAAFAKQPKPIIIDVYTDWCGWCKVMDRETYSNEKVIDYLNKNFYAVKFNAESTAEVIFANKKYSYNPAYNANDLAVYLLGGRMAYPTTVLLSTLNAQPAPLSGYLKPSELEPPSEVTQGVPVGAGIIPSDGTTDGGTRGIYSLLADGSFLAFHVT